MIVRIEAGGRIRAVEVRRGDGHLTVTVDGRTQTVDVHHAGGLWSLILGTRSHEIGIVEGLDGAMIVQVDGQPVPVSVDPARRSSGARGRDAATGPGGDMAGPCRIVAPMPGRIVKVLVKPGDGVRPRQGLVVVEAMKMENELRTQRAGTVSEVCVTEGASVEAGALLVIVE